MLSIITAATVRYAPTFTLDRELLISLLQDYPDADELQYATDSVRYGYDIGVENDIQFGQPSRPYPFVTAAHKLIITEWLINTASIIGPFLPGHVPVDNPNVVPLFVVEQGAKNRVITDFSYPHNGNSLNDNLFGYSPNFVRSRILDSMKLSNL